MTCQDAMLAPSKHADAIPVGWMQTTLQSVTAPRGLKVNDHCDAWEVPFQWGSGGEHLEAHTMNTIGGSPGPLSVT